MGATTILPKKLRKLALLFNFVTISCSLKSLNKNIHNRDIKRIRGQQTRKFFKLDLNISKLINFTSFFPKYLIKE